MFRSLSLTVGSLMVSIVNANSGNPSIVSSGAVTPGVALTRPMKPNSPGASDARSVSMGRGICVASACVTSKRSGVGDPAREGTVTRDHRFPYAQGSRQRQHHATGDAQGLGGHLKAGQRW